MRFTAALLATALVVFPAEGQRPELRDSAILARIAATTPCPTPVPEGWFALDSTLRHSPWCNLLEYVVRAADTASVLKGVPHGDPRKPVCVLLWPAFFTNLSDENDPQAYWAIDFVTERSPWVAAIVNRFRDSSTVYSGYDEFDVGSRKLCARWR